MAIPAAADLRARHEGSCLNSSHHSVRSRTDGDTEVYSSIHDPTSLRIIHIIDADEISYVTFPKHLLLDQAIDAVE